MEKFCVVCGKKFESISGNQKYCSPECTKKGKNAVRQLRRLASRKTPLKRNCDYCGVEFKPVNYIQRFCSLSCREKFKLQMQENLTKIKICPTCGEEFESTSGNQKYCSPECQLQARRLGKKQSQKGVGNTGSEEILTCNSLPKRSSKSRQKQSATTLGKISVSKKKSILEEKIYIRIVSDYEEYTFQTLRQAVNFLSAYSSFDTAECTELLRQHKNKIGIYKIFYD